MQCGTGGTPAAISFVRVSLLCSATDCCCCCCCLARDSSTFASWMASHNFASDIICREMSSTAGSALNSSRLPMDSSRGSFSIDSGWAGMLDRLRPHPIKIYWFRKAFSEENKTCFNLKIFRLITFNWNSLYIFRFCTLKREKCFIFSHKTL